MERIYSLGQLNEKLRKFKERDSKIDFILDYLNEDAHISAEMSAIMHEVLGELLVKSGSPDGRIFEKAASAWERHWIADELHKVSKSRQRHTLRRALLNYKIAMDIYEKKGEMSLKEEARAKAGLLIEEMSEHSTPVNFFVTALAGVCFIFSMLFFSQNFTGLAVADLDAEGSFLAGGLLLAGGFFLMWMLFLIKKRITKLI